MIDVLFNLFAIKKKINHNVTIFMIIMMKKLMWSSRPLCGNHVYQN